MNKDREGMKKRIITVLKVLGILLLLFLVFRLFCPTWTPPIKGVNSISKLKKVAEKKFL